MTTAKRVLDIARSQLGVTENPPGSNNVLYNDWYYGRDVSGSAYPWCAAFTSWVLDQAGIAGFKGVYTPTVANLFKNAGRWHTTPEPGDLAFFDFPDSTYRIQHIGFVTQVNDDGTVTTIEGNTSSSDAGSQDNGGGVFRRRRPTSHIVGYGRPPYNVVYRLKAIHTIRDRFRTRKDALRLARHLEKLGYEVEVSA